MSSHFLIFSFSIISRVSISTYMYNVSNLLSMHFVNCTFCFFSLHDDDTPNVCVHVLLFMQDIAIILLVHTGSRRRRVSGNCFPSYCLKFLLIIFPPPKIQTVYLQHSNSFFFFILFYFIYFLAFVFFFFGSFFSSSKKKKHKRMKNGEKNENRTKKN